MGLSIKKFFQNKKHHGFIIYTSCPSTAEAEKIANIILSQNINACIQIADIRSYYKWEGKVENADEKLLLIKCNSAFYSVIERLIIAAHSYDIPEIIAVPIAKGSSNYLNWLGI